MLALLAAVLFLYGCTSDQLQKSLDKLPSQLPSMPSPQSIPQLPSMQQNPVPVPSVSPEEACSLVCKTMLSAGADLSSGPCLLDPEPQNSDYVCDVAHSPREAVDNEPANQCSSYGKTAHHFVEVAPDCSFIREV